MTPNPPAATPTFAGIMAEPIDVLMRVARELSGPAPNLPALQEMVMSCAQVFVAVRIGVAKMEGATDCPRLAMVIDTPPGTVVDLSTFRAARVSGAVRL